MDKEVIKILTEESEALRVELAKSREVFHSILTNYWDLQEKYFNQLQELTALKRELGSLKHENARLRDEKAELENRIDQLDS